MMSANLFISELLPDEELTELINKYPVGLELIQFSISDNLDHYHDTLTSVRERLTRMRNPEVTIHGPFLDLNPMAFDSKIRQVTMDRFAAAYDAALDLSARRIIFHSGMIPSVYLLEGWADRMAEFWMEFLENRREIPVCMENVLDQEIAPFISVARQVLTDPKINSFGICLDLGHAHCYSNHAVTSWSAELFPYIRHVHLHDNDGTRDQHRALGEGTVPWKESLDHILSGNTDLTCTIECAKKQAVLDSLSKIASYNNNKII